VELKLTPVVANIIVRPEQEEFILQPHVYDHIKTEEEELICIQWETTFE
jgi:hypothetical protein